jgi:hypothetical protein
MEGYHPEFGLSYVIAEYILLIFATLSATKYVWPTICVKRLVSYCHLYPSFNVDASINTNQIGVDAGIESRLGFNDHSISAALDTENCGFRDRSGISSNIYTTATYRFGGSRHKPCAHRNFGKCIPVNRRRRLY